MSKKISISRLFAYYIISSILNVTKGGALTMLQNNCCKKNKCCVDIIICILTSLITLIVGIIIGALTGLLTALGIGAIVAILAILLILLIIRIINLICNKDKKNDCCDYDKYC